MTAPAAVVAEQVESTKSTMRSAQEMAEEGLTFTGTPGPGYSEGGDVFDPSARHGSSGPMRCDDMWLPPESR